MENRLNVTGFVLKLDSHCRIYLYIYIDTISKIDGKGKKYS